MSFLLLRLFASAPGRSRFLRWKLRADPEFSFSVHSPCFSPPRRFLSPGFSRNSANAYPCASACASCLPTFFFFFTSVTSRLSRSEDAYFDASYWGWRAGDTFLCYPKGEPSWRFLELRNGIAAAEKVRILKTTGALDAAAFAKIAERYDVKAANDGKCNYAAVRQATLDFVNR